jgi:hypothetical protein
MTPILVTVFAIGAVVGYLWLGVRLGARPYVTQEVQRNCERWPTLAVDPKAVEEWRRTAAYEGLVLAVAWPIRLVLRACAGRLAASAPLSTVEAERRIKERDLRIAELERQIGMTKSGHWAGTGRPE